MASFEDDVLNVIQIHYPEEIPVDSVVYLFARIIMQLTETSPAPAQPVNTENLPVQVIEDVITVSSTDSQIIAEAANDPDPVIPLQAAIGEWMNTSETKEKRKKASSRKREELDYDQLDDDSIF